MITKTTGFGCEINNPGVAAMPPQEFLKDAQMKKIFITEKYDEISLGSLEGSIESAIEYLKNIWVNLSDGTNKVKLELVYGDSDTQYFVVYTSRLETDEEYEKRMQLNKKVRASKKKEKEEQEKAEYNRYLKLKEKFDGK
jgi:hypothetical protein